MEPGDRAFLSGGSRLGSRLLPAVDCRAAVVTIWTCFLWDALWHRVALHVRGVCTALDCARKVACEFRRREESRRWNSNG